MMTARELIYEQEDQAISLIREHYAQVTMVHRQWVEAEKKLRSIGMGLGPTTKESHQPTPWTASTALHLPNLPDLGGQREDSR